jgi:cyanamide hydratase
MTDHNVEFFGYTAVPRDPEVLFKNHPTALGDHPKQELFVVNDFPLPDSKVVREVKAFVKVCPAHHLLWTDNDSILKERAQ